MAETEANRDTPVAVPEPGEPPPAPVGRPLALDDQLCFSLYTAARLVVRSYRPVLAELGLTYPQYLTMIALWEATDPLTVSDLGARLHLDSATLTPLLKRLETDGYLTRTRDPDDERKVRIELTPRGQALHRDACHVPARLIRLLGADLPDLVHLKQSLDRIIGTLDRPGR
jgi:MarR family transcriptional regulator, organic hydroperoxide resistance regulator